MTKHAKTPLELLEKSIELKDSINASVTHTALQNANTKVVRANATKNGKEKAERN